MASIAADQISYDDLYRRWERGNWRATEIDFTEDRRQWHEDFSELQRRAALWNYSLFFWGEDSVADNLSPFIDAAPREEQKYFLATQQVDEARHAVFFKRFLREVCDVGDGTVAGGLDAIRPQLTWGFVKTFELLDKHADELRRRPLAHEARAGRDDVPHRRRGDARAARPALHRRLPDRARPAARVPRRDPQRRARRAAPHRLRRQAPARPRARGSRGPAGGRRPAARGAPLQRRRVRPAELGSALRGVLRLHARADLRGGRAVVRGQAARGRHADRVAARPRPLPARPRAGRARAARDRHARGRAARRGQRRRRRAIPRRWRCCSTCCAAASTPATRRRSRSRCSGTSPTPSRGTCASRRTARRRRPRASPTPPT